jgi:hypothetical protein
VGAEAFEDGGFVGEGLFVVELAEVLVDVAVVACA